MFSETNDEVFDRVFCTTGYCYEYQRAAITTDIIVLNEHDAGEILLISRKNKPYQNTWALPGGFLEINETLEECAIRELREETGINLFEQRNTVIDFINFYDSVKRDPRERVITHVFRVYVNKNDKNIKAMDDAKELRWFNVKSLPELAFDHGDVLRDYFYNK